MRRAASAKIVPIFAQIWRVTGLHVSSNTWRQKIWPNLAVAIKLLHSLFTVLFGSKSRMMVGASGKCRGRYTAKSDMLMVGQDVGQNVLLISSR